MLVLSFIYGKYKKISEKLYISIPDKVKRRNIKLYRCQTRIFTECYCKPIFIQIGQVVRAIQIFN